MITEHECFSIVHHIMLDLMQKDQIGTLHYSQEEIDTKSLS